MLAALTTRCLAQRTASVTALARTLGCAPKTLTELVDKAAEDNQSQTLSRIDAKLAPPDLTDLALPTGRTLAHLRSCVCGGVLVACRGSRARIGPRVCGTSASPKLPV